MLDGRREFASQLTRRLDDLVAKIGRSERLNEQLKRLGRRTAHSTRDVVRSTELSISSYAHVDEEDDINNYVKSRWAADDSAKASPRQRSPNVGLVPTISAQPALSRPRRRSSSEHWASTVESIMMSCRVELTRRAIGHRQCDDSLVLRSTRLATAASRSHIAAAHSRRRHI